MKTKEALIAILEDARGWLNHWADGFTDEEARDAKGGPANPLAWHLSHIACTQDDVIRLFSDGPGETPDDLRAICGSGAPAPTPSTRYPPLDELWALLDRTKGRLVGLLEDATEAELDRPPNAPSDFFKSLGQAAYEIALHETYHVGSIATLRKAHGK